MFLRVLLGLLAHLAGPALIASLWLVTLAAEGVIGQAAGLRFVDDDGDPLSGATVRVLCYAAPDAEVPLADLLVETDADGRPVQPVPWPVGQDRLAGRPGSLPANCAYVAALHLVQTQPSGRPDHGPAYQVYAASWPPGTRELKPTTGDVPIRDGWPLVLFNVIASLEWQPAAGSTFVADLREGLRQASAYLYDLTEGQMALGPVSIHTGGRGWGSADLRFLAANDYRPAARVGGMVMTSVPYTTSTLAGTVYAPGEVILGRFWDGQDAADPVAGRWSQPAAFRTLMHEWAHYALFLYDEYQDADLDGKAETYCTCSDLPDVGQTPGACGGVSPDLAASAMAYQYTASELWLSGTPDACLGTDQWQVHGQQDWQSLLHWSGIQGLADAWLVTPTALVPGPDLGLADDLFGREPGYRAYLPIVHRGGTPVPGSLELTVNLALSGTFTLDELNTLHPQVYMVAEAAESSPARIVYQGTTGGSRSSPDALGQITLPGVPEGAQARVFVERYAAGGAEGARFVYPPPAGSDPPLADGQTLRAVPTTWQASLDVAYDMVGPLLTTITVTLSSPVSLAAAPVAWLCTPDATAGCPDDPAWRKPMQAIGATTWAATFTAPSGTELPHFGLLRVGAPDAGELIRWFQAGGGVGPAHMDGQAPLRDGLVTVDAAQPMPGQRNRVIFMPAASYDALVASLPPGIQGIIGVPLDVDVLLPAGFPALLAGDGRFIGAAGRVGAEPADQVLPAPVVLTLFYSQDAVDRLGIGENQLRLLHFSRKHGMWWEVPVSGRSDRLNWLATVPVQEDGIYAVGWSTGVPQPTPSPTPTPTATVRPPKATPTPSATSSATLTPGLRASLTPTPTATPTPRRPRSS